jgi:putative DNA primase/helicase
MTTPHSTLYAGPTAEELVCIPEVLKQRDQWVLWRGEDRVDQQTGEVKLNKIPIDPQTLRNADTTDPTTWGTFTQCVAALPVVLEEWEQDNSNTYRGGGIGFVFTAEDPYAGVDLDHCVNPDTGAIADWAQLHINALASYSEITPSGTGLHILVQGALPPRGRKKGPVEMYSQTRFFTMTGWHISHTPRTIEARQEALTAFHITIFGPSQTKEESRAAAEKSSQPLMEDATLLNKARTAKNSGKFTMLWTGETTGYGSQSEADLALCILLAFWTQDAAQIDRLFRQSKLMRDKWDKKRGKQTYGERTIAEALARQTEHYTPDDGAKLLVKNTTQQAQQEQNGHILAEVSAPERLPYTDVWNAKRLVREHGGDLRYLYPWKSWLTWTGTHWQRDETGEVMHRAKSTIIQMVHQAADWLERAALSQDKEDQKAAKAFYAHAASSLQDGRLNAMIRQAQSEAGIPALPEQLDTDPWLLNCNNGTLDLRTGTLRNHHRKDLHTRCLAAPYDESALCPLWDAFLQRIMASNQSLIDFLQRAIGYALTGVIREHVLLILWGTGRNGKSTFLNILRALLGSYAMKAPSELLMISNNDRHPTERADLFGKRFVAAIETEQGRKLAEVFVKEATGGDPIRARRMREDFWEFQPTHKVFLATNHKPILTGTDTAIWERIRLVPFTVTIPKEERDTALPDKLQAEFPGILAWAVRGCLAWQREGLGEPEEVLQATAGYRAEMDVVGEFIEDCCVTGNNAYFASTANLYEAYVQWCDRNGERQPMNKNNFTAQLGERGFTPDRVGHARTRGWRGVGLSQTMDTTKPTHDMRTPMDEHADTGVRINHGADTRLSRNADTADKKSGMTKNSRVYEDIMPKIASAVSAVSASATSEDSGGIVVDEGTNDDDDYSASLHASKGGNGGMAAMPPQFCEGCGRQACWIDRGSYVECSNLKCRKKWMKPTC